MPDLGPVAEPVPAEAVDLALSLALGEDLTRISSFSVRALLDAAAPVLRAQGAAAEREAIALLADEHGVTWLEPCEDDGYGRPLHTHHRRPFAALIRSRLPLPDPAPKGEPGDPAQA